MRYRTWAWAASFLLPLLPGPPFPWCWVPSDGPQALILGACPRCLWS